MRVRLVVRGIVQGVGFRPLVARAARERGLFGSVRNVRGSVEIELQGERAAIDSLVHALWREPAPVEVEAIETRELEERPLDAFHILESRGDAVPASVLPADLATCADCLREIADPTARRHRYPFTTCVRCGPRYSIVEALPYDRARTSLGRFALCERCAAEYDDPADRRYHAEALACPACGPALTLHTPDGARAAGDDAALSGAALALLAGRIVALRGLGGFQLLVRALADAAVRELRRRKQREDRPLAVMFPSLAVLERFARVSAAEACLLASPEAPIVLVERRVTGLALAEAVAPGSPWIGAMLPSTPLHALLLTDVGEPLVCTSGNLSSEPMCVDLPAALAGLGSIADLFLSHDRAIVRPLDDSLARVLGTRVTLLRRARGYAPKPVARIRDPRPILALGAQQKSTLALAHGGSVVLSQHLGDLGRLATEAFFERTAADLLAFFAVTPEVLVCDLHPDYASTRFAERLSERLGVPLVRVQHHVAHVAAVCVEHDVAEPVLGFAWDGTGLGSDGTIWGGEALLFAAGNAKRVAHLAPIPLLGGDRAAREPWRAALGALFRAAPGELERRGRAWVDDAELALARGGLERGVNVTACSSVGRLFDAVAALLGVRARCTFEGQAAMELESLAREGDDDEIYELPLAGSEPFVADTTALVRGVLRDSSRGISRATIARRFHASLVAHACDVAARVDAERVVLSGGCFQNERLSRGVRTALEARGLRVFSGERVPCNDGGIALGQVAVVGSGAG